MSSHHSNATAPADRGPLVNVRTIRREIFNNQVTEWWIRRNVAPDRKIRLGHSTVLWYEADVRAWLRDREGA